MTDRERELRALMREDARIWCAHASGQNLKDLQPVTKNSAEVEQTNMNG
jgi:hypothetical protein